LKNLSNIVIACFIAITANAQAVQAELYNTTSYKVAIFPDSFPIVGLNERFTPSRAQVDKGEKALSRELFKLNISLENQDSDSPIHRRLLQYKRQYFGFTNADGHKVLKIVAYLRDLDDGNFLLEERAIESGTSDNWVVYYNIEKNELFDLEVGRAPTGRPIKTVQLVDRIEAVKLQRGNVVDSIQVQKIEQPDIDIDDE
jgi:hypothetical protein